MNGLQSSPPGWPGSVCSIEGLPALPKGLNGILNSSGGSWRDIEKVHSKRTSLQVDISKSSVIDSLGRSKPARLDATLRKEMVGLRQLDMSLHCQLWSLYESIQEYKGAFQDISNSLLSESTITTENGYSEEEDYYEEEEEGNYGDNVPQDLPGTSLTLQPTQNSRDQLIKESFHIPL
ncbi:leucine repeat adapter protein 25 [Coregonus clupeaformis]|uniref:leucine repeat adapter protein 25 n=1 Tax=Coregonus clupeaformis TaxID=59861 RepID=UPI001BDFC5F2|nr:leucine repeat adapter protein 25 [Coregonus clupeaformis]